MDPGRDWDQKQPQRWNLYLYGGGNPIKFSDPSGKAVFNSSQALKAAGDDVVGRDALKPSVNANGDVVLTYCNKGVQAILHEAGDHSLDNMTAAQMTTALQNPDKATELSYADAVSYAKAGATVVMAKTNGSGPGHVAVVAPESLAHSGSFGMDVPKVYNIGKDNSLMLMSKAFRVEHNPRAYILNNDKAVVDAQRANASASFRLVTCH